MRGPGSLNSTMRLTARLRGPFQPPFQQERSCRISMDWIVKQPVLGYSEVPESVFKLISLTLNICVLRIRTGNEDLSGFQGHVGASRRINSFRDGWAGPRRTPGHFGFPNVGEVRQMKCAPPLGRKTHHRQSEALAAPARGHVPIDDCVRSRNLRHPSAGSPYKTATWRWRPYSRILLSRVTIRARMLRAVATMIRSAASP